MSQSEDSIEPIQSLEEVMRSIMTEMLQPVTERIQLLETQQKELMTALQKTLLSEDSSVDMEKELKALLAKLDDVVMSLNNVSKTLESEV